MARMESCCCFTLRSGSVVCAIYSMILAVIGIGVCSFQLHTLLQVTATTPEADLQNDPVFFALRITLGVVIGIYSLLFTSAFILLFGVILDNKSALIPYIVVNALIIILQILSMAGAGFVYGFGNPFVIIGYCIAITLIILNILCERCVISQYLELRDGRGTAADNI